MQQVKYSFVCCSVWFCLLFFLNKNVFRFVTGQDVVLFSRVDPEERLTRSDEYIEYPIAGSNCGFDGEKDDTSVSKHFFAKFNVENFPKFLLVGKMNMIF